LFEIHSKEEIKKFVDHMPEGVTGIDDDALKLMSGVMTFDKTPIIEIATKISKV
jgi:hypothetical protein